MAIDTATETPKKKRAKRAKKANPGNKDKGARFPLSYIDPQLKKALVKKAEEEGISAAAWALKVIERNLR